MWFRAVSARRKLINFVIPTLFGRFHSFRCSRRIWVMSLFIAHKCDRYDFGNIFKGVDDLECGQLRFTRWRVELEDMINRENLRVWVRQG